MALTPINPPNIGATGNTGSAQRIDYGRKGMKIRHVSFQITDVATDYSSGFTITAAKFGFRNLYTVIAASVRTTGGATQSAALWWTWDDVAGKLRFWSGCSNGTTMVEATATQLPASCIVQIVAIGV